MKALSFSWSIASASLKKAPIYPEGFDPKVVKAWVPNFEQYVSLHHDWVEEWNKIYGYRQ